MPGYDPRQNHQRKHPEKDPRSHGRTTKRRSEIESQRVTTRQHSTARGASARK
jgi:hypothetical protein